MPFHAANLPEPRTEADAGRTGSFLVRSWREGTSGGSDRYYVRNLRTGEDIYLSGARALSDFFEVDREPVPRS